MVARIAAVALLALALAGCRGDEALVLPGGRLVLATASFDPPVHLFGDEVVARLDLIVDRRRLDPEAMRVRPRFHPYERVGGVRVSRTDRGDLTRLRYEARLRCLHLGCIGVRLESAAGPRETGRGERRTFRFAPARVTYEERGRERLLRVVRWPPLEVVSRINAQQIRTRRFVFESNLTPLPRVTYLLPPPLLALLLLLAALALLALPATRLRRKLQARRPPPIEEEPELPPLERALQLVEWARERANGEDRRRALEVLAVALEDVERPEDADEVRALAWAPPPPSPEAAAVIVRRIRETDGRPS